MNWKEVIGYEDLYEVSNTGLIRSKPRRTVMFDRDMLYKQRLRRLKTHKWGYVRVALSRDDVVKTYSVHRLVAEAFIPNPNNYPQVNHIDCVRSNNCVENLEWCTRQQNMDHAVRFGMVQKGSQSHQAKLTEDKVIEMRLNQFKLSPKELADKYKIAQPTVYAVLNRRTWRHV